jgi:hypothetical protein
MPGARAGDEAGHGPDAVVAFVLRSSRPGRAPRDARTRCAAPPRTSRRARRRGRRRGRTSCATRDDRRRSARAGAWRARRRERTQRPTPCLASCVAGTGTGTAGRGRARPGDPPSSPRWRGRSSPRLSRCRSCKHRSPRGRSASSDLSGARHRTRPA